MNLVLLLLFLAALAWMGGVYLFGRRGRIGIYTAGVEFLLLGALLGSGLLFPFSRETLRDMFPFIHIELGWIGLLYGVQFEWRRLRRQPAGDWWLMGVQSLLVMVAVFTASILMLGGWSDQPLPRLLPAVLLLAVTASLSSPWSVGVIYHLYRIRTPLVRRLQSIAVLDDAPGLLVFSLLFFYPPAAVWLTPPCAS